jgi:DNA-binding MarR family transcriptional regulator
MTPPQHLSRDDYQNLLAFRTALRRFLNWSQARAAEAGLTPAQYQLLLAVKGHHRQDGPTVGEVAEYLLLRPQSAVELIDRAAAASLLERHPDGDDGRVTRIRLTPDGERRLDQLVPAHIDELRHLAPILDHVVTHAAGIAAAQRRKPAAERLDQ